MSKFFFRISRALTILILLLMKYLAVFNESFFFVFPITLSLSTNSSAKEIIRTRNFELLVTRADIDVDV